MTPVGALEIAAGLMPINLAVNKLMHRAALHIKMLPNTHAIKWNMPPGGHREDAANLPEFLTKSLQKVAIGTTTSQTNGLQNDCFHSSM